MRKSYYLLLFMFFLLILTACGNGDNGQQTEAEAAALAYAEAVLGNDDLYLSENTCANVPAGSTSLDMYALFTIGMAIRQSEAHTADDLDIDFEASTESVAEDEVLVRIQGSTTFPANLPASDLAPLPNEPTTQLDEVWRMRQEEGVWKWCGGTENQN